MEAPEKIETRESGRSLIEEIGVVLGRLPNKGLFCGLLVSWLLLFHFLGNSTFGYVDSPSLLAWMYGVYTSPFKYDEHGLLIPFVVLGLLWWKRADLLAAEKRIWWPGLLLLGVAIGLHMLGYVVQQQRISVIGLFLGIFALVGMTWGPKLLRVAALPFCLFVFSVPLGNFAEKISFPLRIWATEITVAVAQGPLGIKVIQNGTSIFDPSGKFSYEIAAACSGLRSLTAVCAMAFVFSLIWFKPWWKRAIMWLAAVPLAIGANVFRLLSIIVAAEAFGQEAGNTVHDNGLLSLLPYIPAVAGLFCLGWLLRERRAENQEAMDTRNDIADSPRQVRGGATLPILIAGVLLMAAAAAELVALKNRQRLSEPGVKVLPVSNVDEKGNAVGKESVYLPETVQTFKSAPAPVAQIVVDWLPKDTVFGHRVYAAPDGFEIDCNVVLMGADRTSIHQPQYCLTGAGWTIVAEETVQLKLANVESSALPVRRLTARGTFRGTDQTVTGLTGVFVYWFVTEGAVTANHGERMWLQVVNQLRTGVFQRWAYVSCFALCRDGEEDATFNRLSEFIATAVPQFVRLD